MTITVNGASHELGGPGTLGHLLRTLDISPDRVAVMVNDRILRREERDDSILNEGDRVEILTFIGGG